MENIALDQFGVPMAAVSSAGTLAYVIPGSANRRLVWVSRQGVESPINDTPRPHQNPRLAPDGNRIVVEVAGGDLWLQDVTRSTLTKLTSADTVGNSFAAWIPRSQRVVFRTLTGMWLIDPNGGQPQLIPGTSVNDIPTSASPDGRTLSFVRQAATETGGADCMSCLSTGPSSLNRSSARKGMTAVVSSRPMDDGWQLCRTSRVSSRSMCAAIPGQSESGPYRRRAEPIRSGTGTAKNCSTEMATR